MTSPSPDADRDRPKRSDFRLPWDIIVAPARAFERIAALPEWIVAYVLLVAVALVDAALEYPALLHVGTALARATHQGAFDTNGYLATLLIGSAVQPLVSVMLTAIAITVFAATRNAKNLAKYPMLISLAANTAIIGLLGEFIEAIAIRTRNPSGFEDYRSLEMVLPFNLTFLADKTNVNQALFLSHFGVFYTWSAIVLSFGLARLANIGLVPSLVFVFTLNLVFAFIL